MTIKSLVFGVICGAVISILPLLLLYHRHPELLLCDLNWQKKCFIGICLVAGGFIYPSGINEKAKKNGQNKLWLVLILMYLCGYTICCALCQKLALTTIALPEIWLSSLGLGCIGVAASLEIIGQTANGLKNTTIDWSWLIFMLGVPLLFSVWLPIVAIPGAIIVLRWVNQTTPRDIINL
jgi:hypothetical protein